MKIRIINNQKTWQGDAIPTRIADRPNMTHYEQRTDLHEGDGFYDAILMDIPAGSRLVSETWTIVDHKAVQGGVVKTDAEIEAERIAALVPTYEGSVRALAYYLFLFGLSMPCTEAKAEEAVYSGTKADGKKDPEAMRLMNLYGKLSKQLSDADIYAIGKLIGVAI